MNNCFPGYIIPIFCVHLLPAGRAAATGLPRLSAEKAAVALASLERFYGLKQLGDHKSSMQPLELRWASCTAAPILFIAHHVVFKKAYFVMSIPLLVLWRCSAQPAGIKPTSLWATAAGAARASIIALLLSTGTLILDCLLLLHLQGRVCHVSGGAGSIRGRPQQGADLAGNSRQQQQQATCASGVRCCTAGDGGTLVQGRL